MLLLHHALFAPMVGEGIGVLVSLDDRTTALDSGPVDEILELVAGVGITPT